MFELRVAESFDAKKKCFNYISSKEEQLFATEADLIEFLARSTEHTYYRDTSRWSNKYLMYQNLSGTDTHTITLLGLRGTECVSFFNPYVFVESETGRRIDARMYWEAIKVRVFELEKACTLKTSHWYGYGRYHRGMHPTSHTVSNYRNARYIGRGRSSTIVEYQEYVPPKDKWYKSLWQDEDFHQNRKSAGWKNDREHYRKQWEREELRKYKRLHRDDILSFGVGSSTECKEIVYDVDKLLREDFENNVNIDNY